LDRVNWIKLKKCLNFLSLENGWVPNARLVFKGSCKTGDYHGQMNAELFQKWFREMLLPNIPDNAVIIMDNASYHKVLSTSSPPTPTCSKEKIANWLNVNKIPFSRDCVKAELIVLLKKFSPEPTYVIDQIAEDYGHKVVRTPPYHPELQPIELCWGVLKNEVGRTCDFSMKNLENRLETAFTKVTKDTCKKVIQKVRDIEDEFWEIDAKLEKNT